MKLIVALLVAFLALGTMAHAADCANAADQSTMTACAVDAFKAADAKLNEQYKLIQERLADDADTRQLLVVAERAWVAFREAECTFQASGVDGGSAYPMVQAQCMAAITDDRLRAFETYLSCEEGDLSCPVPAAE